MNAGPKGFDARAGTPPQGNQPENWWAERRSFVSGIPVVFFNAAGALEQVTQELYTVSARLVLRPAWLDFGFALFSFTPSPFLLSSLFVPLLALCRHSVPAFLSLRHIWADYSWTPRRRLPGPWPAAWTRGGVELDCELNVSYGFSFVESGCVDDRCGRVWTVCAVVEPWSSCCQRCPAVGVCACLVARWLCPEPAVPVVKTHWCENDAWVKRVSSKKTMCGTWSSLFSLPVKELEFKKPAAPVCAVGRCLSPAAPAFQSDSGERRHRDDP